MQFGTSVPCLNCLRPFLACFCGGRYEVELVPVARKVEKRNWFRSPGKCRKAELVPVVPGKEKSGTGSGCQESGQAELVPVAREV